MVVRVIRTANKVCGAGPTQKDRDRNAFIDLRTGAHPRNARSCPGDLYSDRGVTVISDLGTRAKDGQRPEPCELQKHRTKHFRRCRIYVLSAMKTARQRGRWIAVRLTTDVAHESRSRGVRATGPSGRCFSMRAQTLDHLEQMVATLSPATHTGNKLPFTAWLTKSKFHSRVAAARAILLNRLLSVVISIQVAEMIRKPTVDDCHATPPPTRN